MESLVASRIEPEHQNQHSQQYPEVDHHQRTLVAGDQGQDSHAPQGSEESGTVSVSVGVNVNVSAPPPQPPSMGPSVAMTTAATKTTTTTTTVAPKETTITTTTPGIITTTQNSTTKDATTPMANADRAGGSPALMIPVVNPTSLTTATVPVVMATKGTSPTQILPPSTPSTPSKKARSAKSSKSPKSSTKSPVSTPTNVTAKSTTSTTTNPAQPPIIFYQPISTQTLSKREKVLYLTTSSARVRGITSPLPLVINANNADSLIPGLPLLPASPAVLPLKGMTPKEAMMARRIQNYDRHVLNLEGGRRYGHGHGGGGVGPAEGQKGGQAQGQQLPQKGKAPPVVVGPGKGVGLGVAQLPLTPVVVKKESDDEVVDEEGDDDEGVLDEDGDGGAGLSLPERWEVVEETPRTRRERELRFLDEFWSFKGIPIEPLGKGEKIEERKREVVVANVERGSLLLGQERGSGSGSGVRVYGIDGVDGGSDRNDVGGSSVEREGTSVESRNLKMEVLGNDGSGDSDISNMPSSSVSSSSPPSPSQFQPTHLLETQLQHSQSALPPIRGPSIEIDEAYDEDVEESDGMGLTTTTTTPTFQRLQAPPPPPPPPTPPPRPLSTPPVLQKLGMPPKKYLIGRGGGRGRPLSLSKEFFGVGVARGPDSSVPPVNSTVPPVPRTASPAVDAAEKVLVKEKEKEGGVVVQGNSPGGQGTVTVKPEEQQPPHPSSPLPSSSSSLRFKKFRTALRRVSSAGGLGEGAGGGDGGGSGEGSPPATVSGTQSQSQKLGNRFSGMSLRRRVEGG